MEGSAVIENRIQVQYLKPFYQKVTGSRLRLVFAHQYFTILKENVIYNFVPTEGKEIIVNLNTMQVENLSEVFVFQHETRHIRLPLYQLLLVSDIHDHLTPLLGKEAVQNQEPLKLPYTLKPETEAFFAEIEEQNKQAIIDQLLDKRDFEGLRKLLGEPCVV